MDRADRVSEILYGVAAAQGLIEYGTLAKRIGMLPHFLGNLLDQVSQRATQKDEPIWSALVVAKDDHRPHKGFYDLARKLRPEYANLDNDVLWQKERERCYTAVR